MGLSPRFTRSVLLLVACLATGVALHARDAAAPPWGAGAPDVLHAAAPAVAVALPESGPAAATGLHLRLAPRGPGWPAHAQMASTARRVVRVAAMTRSRQPDALRAAGRGLPTFHAGPPPPAY